MVCAAVCVCVLFACVVVVVIDVGEALSQLFHNGNNNRHISKPGASRGLQQ